MSESSATTSGQTLQGTIKWAGEKTDQVSGGFNRMVHTETYAFMATMVP